MIKAVIFDLWNTIASKGFSISNKLKIHFKIKDNQKYLENYEKSIQIKRWSSKEEMSKNFLKTFEIPVTLNNIKYVVSLYEKGIKNARLFYGMKNLLEKIKEKYKLGLVSNTTIFEIGFIDRVNIRKLFDIVVCSHDTGKLKKEKEKFEKILKELKVNARECVYIDDQKSNIEAASKLGIKGIQYTSYESLIKSLKRLNIKF